MGDTCEYGWKNLMKGNYDNGRLNRRPYLFKQPIFYLHL